MKPIAVALLALLALLPFLAQAQVLSKSTITLQAGIATTNEFLNDANSIITSSTPGNELSFGDASPGPVRFVGYAYGFYDRVEFGLEFTYQSIQEKAFINQIEAGNVTNTYYSLGASLRYIYFTKDWFSMYGGVAVAYTTEQSNYEGNSPEFESNSSGFLNFHLNPLGLRFGRSVAGTLEFGIGYRGLAAAGLSWRF